MNRNIEQTLFSLLPTQNSDLPPPLVELARSLLTQSRHRVSTLKAEEEIARPYACAHIACDRLKIPLNLPPIDPRPPIPPRIYKRLYSHLDHILPRSAPGSRARAKRLQDSQPIGSSPAGSSPSRPLPSRGTPSKEASLARFRHGVPGGTPSRAASHGSGSHSARQGEKKSALPAWVRPTARFLCHELDGAALGPTVMAGMESIAAPHGVRTDDEWVNAHLAGLLAAVYWFVAERAAMQATGQAVDVARYKAGRARILEVLRRVPGEVKPQADERGAWEGWEVIGTRELDKAVTEVNQRDWLKSDWYRGVLDIKTGDGELSDGGDGEDDQADEEETETPDSPRFCWWKADTMFQDRYDYLTREKKERFGVWKESVMERIRQIEREQADAVGLDQYP
ncbi:Origin recognition complex subunit 6 [Pleurostoma richardsiae]|uniref:Origin recognition complex subunit 6 n=1 Tax=Pleurostoma richardsiae TaxID=41990 RepID=A0AA38RHP2_9PEZI|nr:Origin recognition complex subunit 6 [Pleurostoma richardsiae]